MAISLDGIEYTVDQPTDNALNLLTYINNYLVSIGSTVQYIVNAASPIWLIILGLGYMFSIYQKLVYAAGQAFSIADCSVQQLLNLAEIAGTGLLEGSATTITCHVTAGALGPCDITTALTVTLQYEGTPFIFHPLYAVSILANTTEIVTLQCEAIGPMYIEAGAVTVFDTPPANFVSMTSENAAPGKNPETSAQLRTRLQTENKYVAGLQACITALRSLTGVQTVNLFYNRDLVNDLIIAGVTIPPRNCAMFVQGYSDLLAETYYSYLTLPCVGGAHIQPYVTGAGQDLAITYSEPEQVDVYIKVKVRIPPTLIVPELYQEEINLFLLPASNSLLIGEDYTQKYMLSFVASYVSNDIEIVGITLSLDDITYSDTTDLIQNQIGIIIATNISYEEIV